MLQERLGSVLESMDGGKPIRESRDVDIPLAAAYFFITQGGPIAPLPSLENVLNP